VITSAAGPGPGSALLAGGRLVTPDGVLDPGWIRVTAGRIDQVGQGAQRPAGSVTDLAGRWVLPGFVDIHVHGGGGASFTDGDAEQVRCAAEFHARRGTTSIVASLVTAPLAELERRAALLADLAADGVIAGIHLEGPFLSAARCGAQDPRYLIPPDRAALARLIDAARGYLRMVTIAPELPGALHLIKDAVHAGITAAIGHTDATAAEASAAIDAGATHATHLFNGMRPLKHREPGAVGALLDRSEVTCEVIADGVHLADTIVRIVASAVGPGRLALVSDAMAAAGMPDGTYPLGPLQVRVTDGVARLAEGNSIAGSTVTMSDLVHRAVTEIGLPVPDAADAASSTPAHAIGIADHAGALQPGRPADLVVCDNDFRTVAVMKAGAWLPGLAP
jgi:N-acetylglucosamine-6-phosphate deacetylase